MPLTFFSDDAKSSGNKLFYNEWLEQNPKNKQLDFEVTEFRLVQSGKGYLAITELFSQFIWKNSKETRLLMEAMRIYVKEPNKGRKIFLTRPNYTSEKLFLAADLEAEVTWLEGKDVFITIPESLGSEKSTNPFLG